MALGRESMFGHWYFLCKLSHAKYSDNLHKDGVMWTLGDLGALGNKLKSEESVKPPQWWDFLPVEHYMIPLLYVLIEIGSDRFVQFQEWVSEEI